MDGFQVSRAWAKIETHEPTGVLDGFPNFLSQSHLTKLGFGGPPTHLETDQVARKSSPSLPLSRASVMLLPQQLPCCR
jgi:hypothetical protein